jgi:hypothetical protein
MVKTPLLKINVLILGAFTVSVKGFETKMRINPTVTEAREERKDGGK